MRQRALAALSHRGFEHGRQFVEGNDELRVEILDAFGQRPIAWHEGIQLVEDRLEVRRVIMRRLRAEQRERLLVKVDEFALVDGDAHVE